MKVCEAIGGNCSEVIKKYEELSIQQQEALVNYCAVNPDTCREKYGWVIADSLLVRKAIDRALGESLPSKMVYDLTALVMHQRDAEGAVASTEFAQRLQKQYGWTAEQSELVAGAVLGVLGDTAKGIKGSLVPHPAKVIASNGLAYKSNPKHTPGQPSNRQDAGIEPKDSLSLFEQSVPSSKQHPKKQVRYAVDKEGNVHRFEGANGGFHWNGSTGDSRNPLSGQHIPNEVQKILGVRIS